MARNIGDLGAQRDPVDLTFGYFGLVLRVHPDATDLNVADFLMTAAEIDEKNEMLAMKALGAYFKGLVHPDDWDSFWAASKANRQQMEDLIETAKTLLEEVAGFPTTQRSGSSTGRAITRPKSKGGSSSPARRTTATGTALKALKARPDLQEAVVLAAKARGEIAA